MPRSKEDDAARQREGRSVGFQRKRRERDDAAQAQVAAKQIAQGVKQPTNEAKRKLPRSKEDNAARKPEERSVALRAQAAAKQIAQGVVQPTNEAKKKRLFFF